MRQIKLKNTNRKITGTLSLYGSKSISNRLLLMRTLSGSKLKFDNLSNSADTQSLTYYLKLTDICASSEIALVVDTVNAGTVLRFLSAYLSIREGRWLLTGTERMKERPIEGLVTALDSLGAEIAYAGKKNFPPLRIVGSDIEGGKVDVDASVSSQFVSALMLIAPYLEKGLKIRLLKKPVSLSYILMTQKLMQKFGVDVQMQKNSIVVKPGFYRMKPYTIEPDWSSASYCYEMVALSEGADVFLNGFVEESVQGDRVAVDVFEQLGVATHFEENGIRLKNTAHFAPSFKYDFSSCPDLVPAVLACCAAKGIPAILNGIGHLKHKESDRIAAMKAELIKIGVVLERKRNSVELIPSGENFSEMQCTFDTHADHRIAMALAPLALKLDRVIMNDTEVVNKSYPLFWDDMASLGLHSEEV